VPDSSKDLYTKLTNTSEDGLKDRFNQTENINPEEEHEKVIKELETRSKADDYNISKHLKIIKIVAAWIITAILVIFIFGFVIASCYLFILFIQHVSSDLSAVKNLLASWLDYILLVMATLFIQRIFGDKQK